MIRAITRDDTDALMDLADTIGLFSAQELETLRQMIITSLSEAGDTDPFWLTDDEDDLVGLAYCEPERMANRIWNLQLIGIHPSCQRQGRGARLLRFVEDVLVRREARALLIETMGTPEFEHVRAFYHKSGYDEEARIREFYTEGADKVIFRKSLSYPRE